MSADSNIEWTDHTFNPWEGCAKVSPGCTHCYAETRNERWHGGVHWGQAAPRLMRSEANWAAPLKWNRAAEEEGRRARVFCASLADVFEDRADLIAPRVRLFDLIARTPALDWLLLMKPVDQTKFGFPEGNCFSACVASLLELELDDVPFFMGREDWYEYFARWLEPRGLYPLHFPMGPDNPGPPGLYIAGGPSPRDPRYMHAVVAQGREILFDPNPHRLGLVSIDDVTLLVPVDPAVLTREARLYRSLLRDDAERFIALAAALDVDPAELEDGPTCLHLAIAKLKAELEKAKDRAEKQSWVAKRSNASLVKLARETGRCWCTHEAGDSPCPTHGMDDS